MSRVTVAKVIDMLVDHVTQEIGEEELHKVPPDSIDVIVQTTMDDIETKVYDRILESVNAKLATIHEHQDKWW